MENGFIEIPNFDSKEFKFEFSEITIKYRLEFSHEALRVIKTECGISFVYDFRDAFYEIKTNTENWTNFDAYSNKKKTNFDMSHPQTQAQIKSLWDIRFIQIKELELRIKDLIEKPHKMKVNIKILNFDCNPKINIEGFLFLRFLLRGAYSRKHQRPRKFRKQRIF